MMFNGMKRIVLIFFMSVLASNACFALSPEDLKSLVDHLLRDFRRIKFRN